MKRTQTPRQAAARRLAEMGAACRLQRREGLRPALAIWGSAVAQTLASAPRAYALADPGSLTVKPVWPGLTLDSLRDALHRMGFEPSELEVAELTARTARHGRPVEAALLGRLIGLTAVQRRQARAWSIAAIDQTQRLQRGEAEEQRKKRNAAIQAGKRRAAGALDRSAYLASVRAEPPAGRSRSALNAANYRARKAAASSGPSPQLSKQSSSGPSPQLSKRSSLGPSPAPNVSVIGSVTPPMYEAATCSPTGQFSDAPAARVWPSKSVTSISACGGFGVADGASIAASPEAGSTGICEGLGDGWSGPESEAQIEKAVRLGRTVEIEDPRELLVASVFPDTNDRGWLLETLAYGCTAATTVTESGLRRAGLLGNRNLQRLARQAEVMGGLINADEPLERARALAIRLESEAARRAEA